MKNLKTKKQQWRLNLNKAKDDLSHLIEKAESQKSQLEKEIANLEKTEKELKDVRNKEKKKLQDLEETSHASIVALSETLKKKEDEIEELRTILEELGMKEQNRMEELEIEAMNIKKILTDDNDEQ